MGIRLYMVSQFFFLLVALPADSRIVHIPLDKPYIQGGIDIAEPGDTVLVAPGTYFGYGNTYITFHGKPIVVMSEAGANRTTIRCDSTYPPNFQAFVFNSGEDTSSRVIGFTIVGGAYDQTQTVYIHKASPLIKDCVFTGNRGMIVRSYGPAKPCFVNCQFRNNYLDWDYCAIACFGQTRLFLDNCTFANNSGLDIPAVIILHESSAYITDCMFANNTTSGNANVIYANLSPIVFRGCTFVNNRSTHPRVNYRCTIRGFGSNINFFNCLIANNDGSIESSGLSFEPYSQPILECTNIFGNDGRDWIDSIAGQANINGNFSLDPLFCNPLEFDYRLQANSPCLAINSPCGERVGATDSGCVITDVGEPLIETLASIPADLACYPNPFNSNIRIAFSLEKPDPISLSVYNSIGQRVILLADEARSAGRHELEWHAVDWHGHSCATGIYFVRLTAGDRSFSRAILLLK